jgi:hypothetical protein
MCIVCDKELRPIHATSPHQPYGGVMAVVSGNYGSTIYDPPSHTRSYLLMYVCDECLVSAGQDGTVFEVTKPRPVLVDSQYETWNPPAEDDVD